MKVRSTLLSASLVVMAILLITSAGLAESKETMELLDINQASIEELCVLKGISKVKAAAIVEYRKANGPFEAIEDIKKVKGIGNKTFENIKDYITVTKTD